MSKDNIIGLVLIFGLLIAYSIFMTPSKEEREAFQRKQDSVLKMQQQKQDSLNALKAVQESLQEMTAQTSNNDNTDDLAALSSRLGTFALAAVGQENLYYLENELIRIGISTKGGRIVSAELKKYRTYDSLPLQLITPDASAFGLVFFSNNRIIRTNELFFEPVWYDKTQHGSETITVNNEGELQFGMRLKAYDTAFANATPRYIEYRYSLTPGSYMLGLTFEFSGMHDIIDRNVDYLTLEWRNQLLRQEKNINTERNTSTIIYRYLSDETGELPETKDATETLKTRVKWLAFKQQFFTSTLIAGDHFTSAEISTFTDANAVNPRYLKSMKADIIFPFQHDSQFTVPLQMYLGPTKYSILRKYKLDLERQIPLGWSFFLMHGINRFAVIPVFNFLEGFNLNYGIIILILTILLKIVLSPLTYKTYTSSARMRILKPEIEELNKKYPKKEDALKKQQAMMALYKKAGVNPMSGCVPVLIQMPILIAMFRFFPSSIELRQQSFLWAHDLSTYDSILDLPFTIPFYGDHVSLFTLLMTLSTIAYTYINSKMMDTGQSQMPGMKTMMYIMPVMFLGFFNNYSAGLSYYYLLANLLTFAQMWLIRKFIDEDKIRAKIAANKNKPVKVSGWQKRLEEMARKRGYNPSKR